MKPLLILCLLISFSFLCYLPFSAKAKSSPYSVKVTATVPLHLTYVKNKQQLIVSTNYQGGFMLLNHGRIIKKKTPTEQVFQTDGPFLLIINY